MNKKLAVWVVGGLITASLVGTGVNQTVARAAEKVQQAPMNQTNQMMTMDAKSMAEMMKNPEMQKQCIDMMKNPEMQKAMRDMMKTPEMQGVMKQMLQQDMGFHQMMADLVNSVDMNSDHVMPQPTTPQDNSTKGHTSHHQ